MTTRQEILNTIQWGEIDKIIKKAHVSRWIFDRFREGKSNPHQDIAILKAIVFVKTNINIKVSETEKEVLEAIR